MNNIQDITRFLETLKEILTIIGYSEKDAIEFVEKFLTIAEAKTIKRVYTRLDPASRGEMERILQNPTEIELQGKTPEEWVQQQTEKLSQLVQQKIQIEELQILYREVIEDLLNDYLEEVLPKANEDEKMQIEALASSLQSN